MISKNKKNKKNIKTDHRSQITEKESKESKVLVQGFESGRKKHPQPSASIRSGFLPNGRGSVPGSGPAPKGRRCRALRPSQPELLVYLDPHAGYESGCKNNNNGNKNQQKASKSTET